MDPQQQASTTSDTTPEPAPPVPDVPGLTWRALTGADVPAWHALVVVVEQADDLSERNTPEDLDDALHDGDWKDPARNTLVGLDEAGQPQAFGLVDLRPGAVRTLQVTCWGGVHPRWRRRGVGAALLAWQHARGRELVAQAGGELPARMIADTGAQDDGRQALLAAGGFTPTRWFLELSRPLADAELPAVPLAPGLRIVPLTGDLDEAVRRAHNEAFAEHWGSEPRSEQAWASMTSGSRTLRRDWSFVAMDGDEVAGYALTSAYEQDWEPQGYTAGWTDLLGVRPAWRGRRLAPALLTETIRALQASGVQAADLGVDSENASGAVGLYGGLGYVETRREIAWTLDLRES